MELQIRSDSVQRRGSPAGRASPNLKVTMTSSKRGEVGGGGDRSPDQCVAGTPLEDHQPLTAHNQSVDFKRRCLTGRSVCFMFRANRK